MRESESFKGSVCDVDIFNSNLDLQWYWQIFLFVRANLNISEQVKLRSPLMFYEVGFVQFQKQLFFIYLFIFDNQNNCSLCAYQYRKFVNV